MTTTTLPPTAFWVVLAIIAVLCAVGVPLLKAFCTWAEKRAIDRAVADQAARSFECDFIAEAADVAPAEAETDELLSAVRERAAEQAALDAAQRIIWAEEACAYYDEALAHLDGLRGRV